MEASIDPSPTVNVFPKNKHLKPDIYAHLHTELYVENYLVRLVQKASHTNYQGNESQSYDRYFSFLVVEKSTLKPYEFL